MRSKTSRSLSLAVLCTPFFALNAQAPAGRFDGTWTTTMACDASDRMPAYKWTFASTIANGAFHGQHGEKGGPGYLIIDGSIKDDGTSKLHANGTVQPGKAGLVTQLKGNKYDYYIEAKFTGTTGSGKPTRARASSVAPAPSTSSCSQTHPPPLRPHS